MTGNKINWQDLAADLAASNSMPRKEAEAFVRAFFDTLAQGIMEEKSVKVKALGTFKMVDVQERESVNVNTGERITISGHAKIGFLPDSALKELVNKPFADFQTVILNDGTSTEEMDKIDRKYPADLAEMQDEDNMPAPSEIALPEESATQEEPTAGDAEAVTEPPIANEDAPDMQVDTTVPNDAPSNDAPMEDNSEVASETVPAEEEGVPATSETPEPQESKEEETDTTDTPQQEEIPMEDAQACEAEPADTVATDTVPRTDTTRATQSAEITTAMTNTASVSPAPVQPTQPAHNIWRTSFLTLVVLLLMLACYMVGYLRLIDLSWLCLPPAEPMVEMPAQPTPVPTKTAPDVDSPTQAASKSTAQEDTKPTQEAPKPAAQEPSKPQDKPAAQSATPAEQQEQATSPTTQDSKQRLMQAANQYPQVKGGKYLITGVRKTITVQQGDNLCRLARREYGDKGVVEYIQVLNQLDNPDNITVGCKVKLPELTAKSE